MPIKKIERELAARGVLGNFPRIGKLRKGAEKPEDLKQGLKDLSHFRLTLDPQFEYMRPEFVRIYGDKPEVFRGVQLAAESADQAFDYWFEDWKHAKLMRRCDGEDICVHLDEDMEYRTNPLPCTCDPFKPVCKQSGRLDIVLPEWCLATGTWGKLTIETHSKYDVLALRGCMITSGFFMNQIPEIRFWNVPFVVGRAPKKVPIITTDKKTNQKQRSEKTMSLLYAMIDPEFNTKVTTPLLTEPARAMLSANVNAENNDFLSMEIGQTQGWDRDYIDAETLLFFEESGDGAQNHQENTINAMIAAGQLTDDMTDLQAFNAIQENRKRRASEKQTQQAAKNGSKSRKKEATRNAADEQAQSDVDWLKNGERANAFLQHAHDKLGLNMGDILDALKWCSVDQIQTIEEFDGTPAEAWGACIARKCGYDLEAVAQFVHDPLSPGRFMAEKLINRHAMPF